MRAIDPVTNIIYPRSNVTIAVQLAANMDFQRQKFELKRNSCIGLLSGILIQAFLTVMNNWIGNWTWRMIFNL